MAISSIPGLTALRTSMQWHQERQRVLAENVSNADTPNFRPRDLVRPSAEALANGSKATLAMTLTNPQHIAFSGEGGDFSVDKKGPFEVRPAGNAVDLEEQMTKVASNQMDYQAATSLYSRSLGLLKTAMGKR
jgi:flagellar basal-body rod protein FlgB